MTKVVKNVCDYLSIPRYAKDKQTPAVEQQVSTSEFLKLIDDKTPEELAVEVFKNRRPTSSKSGILKTDAVRRFFQVLKQFNGEYFQDVQKLLNNAEFENSVKNIPGQGSGITLKYFFMLAGSDDIIKPDRMILRFLQSATGQKFNAKQAQSVLYGVTVELNKKGYGLTVRSLDHMIWNYQRQLGAK